MNRRTRSQAMLRSTNSRAPRSPLVAANHDEARRLYEARVARQREERAARYAARVARAQAREAAARPPPQSPPPPPQAPTPIPSPTIRRPLATICGNGIPRSYPPRPASPIPAGVENAPPPPITNFRSPRHNRSSTDRVVVPYTFLRRLR